MRYLNAMHIEGEDVARRICQQLCNYVGGRWGYDEIREKDGVYIIGTTSKWTKKIQESAYYFILGYLEANRKCGR